MKCSFLTNILLLAFTMPYATGEAQPTSPAHIEEISADQDIDLPIASEDSDDEDFAIDGQDDVIGVDGATDAPLPSIESVSRDIFQGTQKLWILLSQIDNKQKADEGAEEFRLLTRELIRLDMLLGDIEHQNPEAEDSELTDSIVEGYRAVDTEFISLYKARCFGSESLYQAFEELKGTNFFNTSTLPKSHPDLPKLNPTEEQSELARLKQLIAPDTAILKHLSQIDDTKSADYQCKAIIPYLQKLENLRPPTRYLYRYFTRTDGKRYSAAETQLQRLLWDMRTEYVRIAALPLNPLEESHELLAHTLDELYYNLEVTHHYWFTVVFDNSFILDMDEAFRESEMRFQNSSY